MSQIDKKSPDQGYWRSLEELGDTPEFRRFADAEFPAEALPGDRIDLDVRIVLAREEGTLCEGVATVDGETVGRAEFMIVFVPPEAMPPPDPALEENRRNLFRGLNVPEEAL